MMTTNHPLIKLIQNRRTQYEFLPQEVPVELINTCLEAAVCAPNHKLTKPWRFWVLGKHSQSLLAETYGYLRASKRLSPTEGDFAVTLNKARAKFIKIPQVVLVGQVMSQDALQQQEDYAACACAIQNFQLAASALGLGVQWSTGPVIHHPQTTTHLQLDTQQLQLIAALYVGFPASTPAPRPQPDISSVTTYWD